MNPNFGDIVYVDRGLYKHFGVYSGNNKVIHYTKDEKDCLDGTIRETSLSDFLGNEKVCHVLDFSKYSEDVKKFFNMINDNSDAGNIALAVTTLLSDNPNNFNFFSPEETVQRARSCIGQKEYNLVCKNCEHFAFWCKTGLSNSLQVQKTGGFWAYLSTTIIEGLLSMK